MGNMTRGSDGASYYNLKKIIKLAIFKKIHDNMRKCVNKYFSLCFRQKKQKRKKLNQLLSNGFDEEILEKNIYRHFFVVECM